VFDPTTTGAANGSLTVSSNDTDEPEIQVALSGNGVEPDIAADPTSLDFGDVDFDAGPTTLDVEISNEGLALLRFGNPAFATSGSPAFSITNSPSDADLPAAGAVTVTIAFDPTAKGPYTGSLDVLSNDPDTPTLQIPLSGNGVVPDIMADPTGLDFGGVNVDDGPSTLGVTISNEGLALLRFGAPAFATTGDTDFSIANSPSNADLPASGSVVVIIAFDPATEGAKSGILEVLSNDPDTPTLQIPLSGAGLVPDIAATPPTLTFDDRDIDDGPIILDVEISNEGDAPLVFGAPAFDLTGSSAFYIFNSPATANLAPSESVTVTIAFDPATEEPHAGSLQVLSNDPDTPTLAVPLDGIGTQNWGPPTIISTIDNPNHTISFQWTNPFDTPWGVFTSAYDMYNEEQMWFTHFDPPRYYAPYGPLETSSTLPIVFTGGYHVWAGNMYPDGSWYNSIGASDVIYTGPPHTPRNVSIEDLGDVTGGRKARLHWRSDEYGTWAYQIIVFLKDVGFVEVDNPCSEKFPFFGTWCFISYDEETYDEAKADFFEGWADFVLPDTGRYTIFIRGASWLPPYIEGEFGSAVIIVE